MPIPVIMPKLEMSQETATIVEWLKKEGEAVKKGEPLMTVETDKVTVDIESTAEGILAGITAQVGETVPVTTVVAHLLQPGEELSQLGIIQSKDKRAASLEGVQPAGAMESPVSKTGAGSTEANMTPDGKLRASPAARRVARQKGIQLEGIKGSGPNERIQSSDLPQQNEVADQEDASHADITRVVPLAGMRKTIAGRMLESYQSIPHIGFTVRVDMTALETLRAGFQAQEEKGSPHVSLTVLFVKLTALVLKAHPFINSTLRQEEILLLPQVNLGVAVALPAGLIVPVIQDADMKTIFERARELAELTRKARENRLQPVDVAEGTFTISNLGPYGIEQFSAIINPGQAGILAVGAAREEVVPLEGKVVIRPMLRMTLYVDHRIVDGAMAALFLKDLKAALEKPDMIPGLI
jgi:pyruvate dehydrogenase E2 component (dihydrolipoamide acetyltransferase)